MARLVNGKRKEFIRLYCVGPDDVRGNGTRCYMAVYPDSSEEAARSSAATFLANPNVREEIRAFHAEAQAASIALLRDWKVLAPGGQATALAVRAGYLLYVHPDTQERSVVKITTGAHAVIAGIQLKAAQFLVDRAYPKELRLDVTYSQKAERQELGEILGVPPEDMPQE